MNRDLIHKLRAQLNLLGKSYHDPAASSGSKSKPAASSGLPQIETDSVITGTEDADNRPEPPPSRYQRIIQQMENPPPPIRTGKKKGVISSQLGPHYQINLQSNATTDSPASDYCTKMESDNHRLRLRELLAKRYRQSQQRPGMPLDRPSCSQIMQELLQGSVIYRAVELTESVSYGTKIRCLRTDGAIWQLGPPVLVAGATPTHLTIKKNLQQKNHDLVSRHHLILVEIQSPWGQFNQRNKNRKHTNNG